MALRKILLVTEDNEILRKKSKPVEVFDDRLHELLDDMAETMYKAKGAGISAVQIGVLRRAFIIDTGKRKIEFINPEIVRTGGENKIVYEGCLSVPHTSSTRDEDMKVRRPNTVRAKFFDRNGEPQEIKLTGYEAKAFCHEFDHLNGIVFTDWIPLQKNGRTVNTPEKMVSPTVI